MKRHDSNTGTPRVYKESVSFLRQVGPQCARKEGTRSTTGSRCNTVGPGGLVWARQSASDSPRSRNRQVAQTRMGGWGSVTSVVWATVGRRGRRRLVAGLAYRCSETAAWGWQLSHEEGSGRRWRWPSPSANSGEREWTPCWLAVLLSPARRKQESSWIDGTESTLKDSQMTSGTVFGQKTHDRSGVCGSVMCDPPWPVAGTGEL